MGTEAGVGRPGAVCAESSPMTHESPTVLDKPVPTEWFPLGEKLT